MEDITHKSDPNTNIIAFADDIVFYFSDNKSVDLQKKLQPHHNHLRSNLDTWKLKINASKCENVIWRKTYNYLNKLCRSYVEDFQTNDNDENGIIHPIPTVNGVKYLRMQLDYVFRLNSHIKTQLNKANKDLRANGRIFLNHELTPKTKIICYMLLIRPIITYAAPIWQNASASIIKKIKAFERNCLRHCLRAYRTLSSRFEKYISNKTLYDITGIPRIDIYLLQLTRNYLAKEYIIKSKVGYDLRRLNNQQHIQMFKSGYTTPHSFIIADSMDLL